MDENRAVTIQGVSESMSRVFSFVTALDASPFFEGVKTKSTATKKDKNKDVAVFEIVLTLTDQGGSSASADQSQVETKGTKKTK
ncbi:MAG: PilN domain-containing protein [Candidatus Omnitrophica bacterium]|nr:PilN domain-containing protein [Candidatus Omnitrophota bacterium]